MTRQSERRLAAWMAPVSALLLSLGLLALPGRAHAAPGAKLHGKWKAEAMEVNGKRYPVKPPMKIEFEFQPGGKFVVTMTHGKRFKRQEGTWSATATKLTMTVAGKSESMPYKVRGRKLIMKKKTAGRTVTHYMIKTR